MKSRRWDCFFLILHLFRFSFIHLFYCFIILIFFSFISLFPILLLLFLLLLLLLILPGYFPFYMFSVLMLHNYALFQSSSLCSCINPFKSNHFVFGSAFFLFQILLLFFKRVTNMGFVASKQITCCGSSEIASG